MYDKNNKPHYEKQTLHVTVYNITDNILTLYIFIW